MHKMSSNDMATVEMLQEREKQQKEALEQVLKIEEQKQKEAARPTAKITHKGKNIKSSLFQYFSIIRRNRNWALRRYGKP